MSYKGYSQKLCKQGHLSTVDAYGSYGGYGWTGDGDKPKCRCGAEFVWECMVNETNDAGYKYDAFEVAKEAVIKTCPTCDHVVEVEEVQYKIPTEEDMRAFEDRRDAHYHEHGRLV